MMGTSGKTVQFLLLLLQAFLIRAKANQNDQTYVTRTQEPETSAMLDDIAYRPLFYDLVIKMYLPDYDAKIDKDMHYKTEGEVMIQVEILKPTKHILIDYENLTIEEVVSSKELASWNVSNNKINVVFGEEFNGRTVDINIRYTGFIRDDGYGLYKTTDGRKFAAVTQFELWHARKAVPCFDEPRFKAYWNVTIVHPKGTTALSNAPEILAYRQGDFIRTKFATSPLMPSYILAFFVSEYQYLSTTTRNGVEIKIWTPKDFLDYGRMALNASSVILSFFEDLFGIPYPLRKLDFVAVKNFKYAAMENIGLIVHRVDYLLAASAYPKESIVETISHEIAHQWFGNLVTTKSWDHLWLNEGITSYFEHAGLKAVINDATEGSNMHALKSDRHLSSVVRHMETEREAIGFTTYKKGKHLVHMIRGLVNEYQGKESFMSIIKGYLMKYANKNVVTEDFLLEFGVEIAEKMRPWFYQPSHPIVTVCAFNSTHKRLHQRSANDRNSEDKWDIPIWIRFSDANQFYWLSKDKELYLNIVDKKYTINPDHFGFYEVDDQTDPLSSLKKVLTERELNIKHPLWLRKKY